MVKKASKIIGILIFIAFSIAYLQVVTIYIVKVFKMQDFHLFYKSLIWIYQSRNNTDLFNELISPFGMFAFIIVIGVMISAYYNFSVSNKRNKSLSLHGSARWATIKDIEKSGLLSNTGVVVGGFLQGNNIRYLIHDGPEHIYTYAPTRSGKGVSLIIPTLCTWRNSVVATDIKGELWSMTAGYRQKYMNNKVIKFEPTKKGSAKWNPLDEIRIGTDYETSDAQSLALMIADPQGKGLEDHWVKSAYSLITGVILYLVSKKANGIGEASMRELDKTISDTSRPINELWEDMKKSENTIARQVGQDMLDKPENEGGSIVSTAKTELSLYRDPIVAENTSFSNFNVKDLMNYDTPISLYIITSPENIGRIRPLFRLLINMMVRKNVSEFSFTKSEVKELSRFEKLKRRVQGKTTQTYGAIKGKGAYKHRLLLMLDEFPSLGKIDIIQEALAYMAGYGIKAYIISQDIEQLYDKYGKNESITSNCHIQNAFAPNKGSTAEYLSKLTGDTTVVEERTSVSDGGFLGKKTHTKNYEHTKRALLTPNECMNLRGALKNDKGEITKPGEMLIFVAGSPVIRGVQSLYFQNEKWNARASILPPDKTDVLKQDLINIENFEDVNIEDMKGADITQEESTDEENNLN